MQKKRLGTFFGTKACDSGSESVCSACRRRKSGFTIVELAVVIVIINLLSGVAIPKMTDYIERTKQKLDVLKLFDLRNALNRALYETDVVQSVTEGEYGTCKTVSKSALESALASNKGVALFIIQRSSYMPVNYQGTHGSASTNNMCGLTFSSGVWNTAMKEAGFGAVADIIADRAAGDKINTNSKTYTAVKNAGNNSWWRTYPTNPIFQSRMLQSNPTEKTASNTAIALKIRWAKGDPNSKTLEVFFGKDNSTDESALLSRQGVCFSTRGAAGCKKSQPSY